MALEYLAGQILTAARLQKAVPNHVEQGTDQTVASSTTLEETNLAVPVDDLVKIVLNVRWGDQGGGIRWDWTETGSVTVESRDILSPGSAATGGVSGYSEMRFRMIQTTGESQDIPFVQNATSHRITEELILRGSGTVTFRFAQETSNASPTTVFSQSHVEWQYLAE